MRSPAGLSKLCFGLFAVAVTGIGLAPPAHAIGVSQLSSEVRSARNTAEKLARGAWDNAAETRLVDRVDTIADHFHELASTGARIPQTANSLLTLIERTHRRYTSVLENMQAEVIRQDGDLEAVQDSRAWRERELLATRLQYRLNWIRYEIATRYENSPAKRTALLKRARDGFTEFLSVGDRELTIESLLGHGLTSKTLKDYDTAIRDFRDALSRGPDSETAVKLRLALAEIYLTTGRIGNALSETKRLTKMRASGVRNQVRFLRAKALLLAVGKYRKSYDTSTRASFRREAASTLEKLYGASPYWRNKVVQLIDAGIETPLEWAAGTTSPFVKFLIASSLRKRGDCDQAVVLYSALLEQDRFVAESHYGTGFCEFYEGRYDDAIRDLTEFLDDPSDGEAFLGQAAYLRFKAAESLYLREENKNDQLIANRYLIFLKDFLQRSPQHTNAYEAWFRLGEWHREREQWVSAAEAFGKVQGDPALHLKAAFQSAQSYFEAVLDQNKSDGTPDPKLVQTALAALDRFVDEAGQAAPELTQPLKAKAVIMAAGICAHIDDGMHERLRRLQDFEERFADQKELFPEVSSLRIVAYRRLGNLDAAGSELEKLLANDNAGGYRSATLQKLGVVFLKEAAKRDDAGEPEAARRARGTALRIYERLLSDLNEARGEGDETEAERGMEKLVSDLRRQMQH